MNPWLTVPASDYEGHMEAVGQSQALREIFQNIYRRVKPRRLAILGCGTAADVVAVDPALTDEIVGVDLNPEYLGVARGRLTAWGDRAHLLQGDVLQVDLGPAPFDLVHAALLFEYVDPGQLFRTIAGALAPAGTCSVVLQVADTDQPSVSPTRFASVRALGTVMTLHEPAVLEAGAAAAGLMTNGGWQASLPDGKRLAVALFTSSAGSRS